VVDANVCTASGTATLTQPLGMATTIASAICKGETYVFGTNLYSVSGVYQRVLTSKSGCDSTVTAILTVDELATPQITVSKNILSVNIVNAAYQWKECKSNAPALTIAGANAISFTGMAGKSFAVEVSKGACKAISGCENIDILSTTGLNSGKSEGIYLYPNPAFEVVYIQCAKTIESVIVRDLTGNMLMQWANPSQEQGLSLKEFSSGMYWLQIQATDGSVYAQRLIVNK
jgi:hypothetical protein